VANIATVATLAVVRPGVPRGRVTGRGLLRVMTRYFGQSYCVSPWRFDDYPRRCIYTQHGEKWSATGVDAAWQRYGTFLGAIWVRWYDEGGDHDRLFRYGAGGYDKSDWCRYAFDTVRLTGETAPPEDGGLRWRPVVPGVWEERSGGTYLAGNDRCDLLLDHPTHPSRTTPVRGHMQGRETLYWKTDMPPAVAQPEPFVLSRATGVEFLWRGRATRVYRRRGDRWWAWCLDDWDNCADPGWLADRTVQDRLG